MRIDADNQPPSGVNARLRSDRATDELIGLARGLMADDVLTEPEIILLVEWINANPDACSRFPGTVLIRRLERILEDGVIDEEEVAELEETLRELLGETVGRVDGASMASTLPLDAPPPPVKFSGKTFVFTGKFAYGPRRVCEGAVTALGARAVQAPSRKVDYVVIGTVGSRDWAHSAFGRKIEYAMELRDAGSGLQIVSEEHWAEQLELAEAAEPPVVAAAAAPVSVAGPAPDQAPSLTEAAALREPPQRPADRQPELAAGEPLARVPRLLVWTAFFLGVWAFLAVAFEAWLWALGTGGLSAGAVYLCRAWVRAEREEAGKGRGQ